MIRVTDIPRTVPGDGLKVKNAHYGTNDLHLIYEASNFIE
jgi:hypothetical protein